MQKVLVKIKITIKKEPVLSIAVILAVISMFVVHPDDTYVSYIDFRTLAILFCLMVIVAGIREIGVFDYIAQSLLNRVKSISGIVMILVLLCFFLSMVITNDVALITFVPFAILILKRFPKEVRCHWLIPCVVMQTAAANLGSMMTPIGNPQNLYLYGKANLQASSFFLLMLPYTVLSLLILIIWIAIHTKRKTDNETNCMDGSTHKAVYAKTQSRKISDKLRLTIYLILFFLSLLAVGRLISIWIVFACVIAWAAAFDSKLFRNADYALLGTFTALFVFIGNLGRIPQFCSILQNLIQTREVIIAVAASQG